MLMVSPVNISIGVLQYFTAVRECIFAFQARLKSHMCIGTLLRIILRLDLTLSIFITPLDMFYQGGYGSVVLL